jgi:hypothetical protein
MTVDRTKLQIRKNALRSYRNHFENLHVVTEAEIHAFVAGFNIGWEGHRTKQIPKVKQKMTSDQIDFMHEYDLNNCGCEECKKRRQKEIEESEGDPIKFHVRESEGDFK